MRKSEDFRIEPIIQVGNQIEHMRFSATDLSLSNGVKDLDSHLYF
jgi:hypothetical protein